MIVRIHTRFHPPTESVRPVEVRTMIFSPFMSLKSLKS